MDSSLTFPQAARPNIIQGGMGIGVSTWRLARRVARRGEVGVVSGTGIDAVTVRELQDSDPNGRRHTWDDYPDSATADELVDRFYRPDGKPEDEPYDLLPMHRFDPTSMSQRALAAAAYSEVRLAKAGHDGLVGINLLAKLKRYTLPCIYGALLAGVDIVSIGAGIPLEEARQIPKLAAGEPAELRLDADTTQADGAADEYTYRFDPAVVVDPPPTLDPPAFFPIVSSDILARILDTKLPSEHVDGFVIERHVAGGHNAPPRNKTYEDDHTPVYDDRDEPDLDAIPALGKPFFLAGGFGSPKGLRFARSVGATGIQVGSLFSLADESGYPPETTRRLIRGLHTGEIEVQTDGRASSTGFPFKVLTAEGTLAEEAVYERRSRVCDLGYLREPYLDEQGRLMGRCPAEPVQTYVSRGGEPEAAEGRACLCNALLANIGLGQWRGDQAEPPLFTGGDALENLPLGSAADPQYDADDVIDYLYGDHAPPRRDGATGRLRPAD